MGRWCLERQRGLQIDGAWHAHVLSAAIVVGGTGEVAAVQQILHTHGQAQIVQLLARLIAGAQAQDGKAGDVAQIAVGVFLSDIRVGLAAGAWRAR